MSFEKLSISSLQDVATMLEGELPKSAKIYTMCSFKLKGMYAAEDSVEFYSYNGVPHDRKDLFLIGVIEMKYNTDRYSVVYSPEKYTQEMLKAFEEFYDWSQAQDFESIPLPFAPEIKRAVTAKGGNLSVNLAQEMYMPVTDALKLDVDIPNQFKIAKLAYNHGKTVNDNWRYGFEGGDVFLGREIECFGGFGCFLKGDEDDAPLSNENLVCWVIRHHMGTLNALYTLPEYRRKGLASLVMKAAAKDIAQNGFMPICETDDYNKESRCLLERIGFKISQDVNWMHCTPPNKERD